VVQGVGSSSKGRKKKKKKTVQKGKEIKLPESRLSSAGGWHGSDRSGRVGTAFHPQNKAKVTNILKLYCEIIVQQVKKRDTIVRC